MLDRLAAGLPTSHPLSQFAAAMPSQPQVPERPWGGLPTAPQVPGWGGPMWQTWQNQNISPWQMQGMPAGYAPQAPQVTGLLGNQIQPGSRPQMPQQPELPPYTLGPPGDSRGPLDDLYWKEATRRIPHVFGREPAQLQQGVLSAMRQGFRPPRPTQHIANAWQGYNPATGMDFSD